MKWNKSTVTALQQIKDKKYPSSIVDYTGEILLVAMNYDKNKKEHQCLIEKQEKEQKSAGGVKKALRIQKNGLY